MEKIKTIIIDDEQRARSLLSNMLTEYCPDIHIVADCEDLPNGVKAIRKFKPNLVLLDIEMPGHSGLEILDFFDENEINFSVIFITAYNQYAINAFKLSALDYLLKPIEPQDLEDAISRYKKRISIDKKENKNIHDKLKNIGSIKIAAPTSNGLKFIAIETIMFIKADNSYTEVHINDGSKLVVSRTLKNFEDVLKDYPTFYRCHKSYIINLLHVSDYVKSDGGYVVINNSFEVPIASEKVQDFLNKITVVKR